MQFNPEYTDNPTFGLKRISGANAWYINVCDDIKPNVEVYNCEGKLVGYICGSTSSNNWISVQTC